LGHLGGRSRTEHDRGMRSHAHQPARLCDRPRPTLWRDTGFRPPIGADCRGRFSSQGRMRFWRGTGPATQCRRDRSFPRGRRPAPPLRTARCLRTPRRTDIDRPGHQHRSGFRRGLPSPGNTAMPAWGPPVSRSRGRGPARSGRPRCRIRAPSLAAEYAGRGPGEPQAPFVGSRLARRSFGRRSLASPMVGA
jgi:hypothetical protein